MGIIALLMYEGRFRPSIELSVGPNCQHQKNALRGQLRLGQLTGVNRTTGNGREVCCS